MKPTIPKTVWTLGFVSLFMDLSSELVHSLLPVFLVSTLGASVMTVGFIEGIAEATALIAKVFSGVASDFFRRRKMLILLGYGMAALTKPLFPLATSVGTVLAARFLDRVGKGMRGAPRDALVADVSPPEIRGACFGLRQAMDTIGAVLGPCIAMVLMYLLSDDIRKVLWFGVIPALVTVVIIVVGVHEPDWSIRKRPLGFPLRSDALKRFSPDYWRIVFVGAVFTLARFSEAFLVLRAQQVGLGVTWVPLVMVVMSLVYSVSAYPAGALSDRINRTSLLEIGLATLVAGDLVLAWASSPLPLFFGVALWGLHMGFTQGILTAMIADVTPPELKGTAFGFFNLASGLCMLLASVVAGALWETFGAEMTFYSGAVFSLGALIAVLVLFAGRQKRNSESGVH